MGQTKYDLEGCHYLWLWSENHPLITREGMAQNWHQFSTEDPEKVSWCLLESPNQRNCKFVHTTTVQNYAFCDLDSGVHQFD